MRSRLITAAIALVLLACIACPLSEMFDRWDHTLKTGKDTESGVMILAVCVGAVISISLGEVILILWSDANWKSHLAPANPESNFFLIIRPVIAVSQPPPPLRI